jgi:hypothetical protein
MRKVNTNDLPEDTWSSPKGKFAGAGKTGFGSFGTQAHFHRFKGTPPV